MKVEIREKIKEHKMLRELSKDHRSLFEQKLQKELHRKPKSPKSFLMIAASVIVLFSLGYLITNVQQTPRQMIETSSAKVSLEEFSPELKKVENYYLTAISFEMANLKVTDDNKMILEEGKKPNSIYHFCQLLKIEETQFYQFFSSFEQIEESVFEHFFENTFSIFYARLR